MANASPLGNACVRVLIVTRSDVLYRSTSSGNHKGLRVWEMFLEFREGVRRRRRKKRDYLSCST